MRFSNVCIQSACYVLPTQAVTSAEIEERLIPALGGLLQAGKLEELTGVASRRVWPKTRRVADLAAMAGEKLLAGLDDFDRRKIGLLAHCGVCRDYVEPATAAVIHHELNLDPHCMVFDLSNACVGFLNAMLVAANMIESGQLEYALVVTGENSGPVYEPTIKAICEAPDERRFRNGIASLTLGSASVAYLLGRADAHPDACRLLGGVFQADSRSHDLCRGYGTYDQGFQMETDTYNLMKNGLVLSQVTWELFKNELGWTNATADHYITHQISKAHHTKVFQALGIEGSKGYADIDWLGNTGSAAAPLSLLLRRDEGVLSPGDRVAVMGIGSGLNAAMLGIQW